MIVKWEDDKGISYLDYVVHVTKLNDEEIITAVQATLDHKLVSRTFSGGSLMVISDTGATITQYDLGPNNGAQQ